MKYTYAAFLVILFMGYILSKNIINCIHTLRGDVYAYGAKANRSL